MPLALTANLNLQGAYTKASDLAASLSEVISFGHTTVYSDGAGVSMINQWFSDTRTLSPSATEDLDLAGATYTDSFGVALAMVRMKVFVVRAAAANTNNVNVSRPTTNGVPWTLAVTTGVPVQPGECKVLVWTPTAAGVLVTAGTGDLITITNSAGGTSVTYDVLIGGSTT